MPIIAKKSNNDLPPREPVPAGTHIARCYQVIHIGTVTSEYQGKESHRDRVRIGFELPNVLREFKEGEGEKPMVISEEYTLSLADTSNLKPLLENWRGKAFIEAELEAFDIEKLLGVPALITVVHTKKGDKVYANIGAVAGMVEGMKVPKQVNPSKILSYDSWDEALFESLPNFIKEKITTTPEYAKLKGITHPLLTEETETEQEVNIDEINLDDIPF